MTTVSLDFETRSTVDLRITGVYPYAEHRNTGVWCMAWAIDDGPVHLWRYGNPFPGELREAIAAGCDMRAWNAQFERVIWNLLCRPRMGWPSLDLEQWHDTAAEAAAMALPRSLAQCAGVLGVTEQKDDDGHSLMMRMARPRKTTKHKIVWWDEAERLAQLYEYCKQDVRTERAIAVTLRRLSDKERSIYLLDQQINDRGVLVDVPLVRASRIIAKMGLDEANESVRNATGGAVERVTKVADLTKWLRDTEGLNIDNVRKSTVRELLESDGLSSPARQALEARADAGRSSVAKLESMLSVKCKDARLRGMLFYHGAATGRWSGRLVQPQNFPRGEIKNAEQYIDQILAKDYAALDKAHPPLAIISSLLRGMLLAADGHTLMVGDFAQIEARVLAWLAGQQELVEAFANGEPVYEMMAERVYGLERGAITKDDPRRQLGKATVLGCGYGMGPDKFIKASWDIYGVDVSEAPPGMEQYGKSFSHFVVQTYRNTNSKIRELWYRLGDAALDAVLRPGEIQEVRGCKFVVRGAYLWLMLPSKRPLAYAAPTIEDRMTPWGEMKPAVKTWGLNSMTRKWEPRFLYGGLLAENVVQALARDIMAEAMLRLDNAGYPTILTVHDEVVTEPPLGYGSLDEFLELMSRAPAWANGCPVASEGWTGRRYRK